MTFEHRTFADGNSDDVVDADDVTDANMTTNDKHMVYYGKRPSLNVYDNKTQVNSTGNTVVYNATENTMRIYFASDPTNISQNDKVRIAGDFPTTEANADIINGREFTVNNKVATATPPYIEINTTGLNFPDDGFTMTQRRICLYCPRMNPKMLKPFLRGQQMYMKVQRSTLTVKKLCLEKRGDAVKHGYTNADVVSRNGGVSSSALISGGFNTAVTSAAITSGGTGQPAVPATVAVTAADISVVPAGGENMTASVTIDGTGAVTAIALSGGIDYKAGQTVTIDATSIAGLSSNVVFTLPASQPLSSTIEVTAAQITTTSAAGSGMTATVVTDASGSPTISLTGGTGYVVGDRITLGTGGALTTPIVMEITGTEGDGIFNIKGAEFDIDRPVNTVATDLNVHSRAVIGAVSASRLHQAESSLLVQLLRARHIW